MAMRITAHILASISQILDDLEHHSPNSVEQFASQILQARRVFLLGVGRSGLVAKAFAMHLVHLGITAYIGGETTTPRAGGGDLVIVVSASGSTASILAIAARIGGDGAELALITASGTAPLRSGAKLFVLIPCPQFCADNRLLPLGSSFELSAFIYLESIIAQLADRLAVSPEAMRLRHSNLE